MNWFGVRCIIQLADGAYEERVTLWRAPDSDEALARAEAEATDYAADNDGRYLGLAQGFELFDEPGDGAEVFSLTRVSGLEPDDYLDAFFDTGDEQQEEAGGDETDETDETGEAGET
jgi:hypothetical protein